MDRGWASNIRSSALVFGHAFLGKAVQRPGAAAPGRRLFLEHFCFLVARIRELLALMMRALPHLFSAFVPLGVTRGTSVERTMADAIYARIPSVNFSEEVLQRHSQRLALCPVRNVRWSDLGDPRRVLAVLEWTGIRPQWSA